MVVHDYHYNNNSNRNDENAKQDGYQQLSSSSLRTMPTDIISIAHVTVDEKRGFSLSRAGHFGLFFCGSQQNK
jgi:hypothetical protein